MYTYEIEQLLRLKNNLITYKEFLEITRNSPQIDHIKYNPYQDNIEMWSTDNGHFILKLKKEADNEYKSN